MPPKQEGHVCQVTFKKETTMNTNDTPQSIDPYAPPQAQVYAPQFHDGEQAPLADRSQRLVAIILDGLIGIPIALPIIIGIAMSDKETGPGMISYLLFAIGGLMVLGLLAYNLMLLHKSGQTLGKKWAKVKIVRNDGSRASLGRIFGLRILVNGLIGAIPLLGPFYSLADILFIFREDRRCLHDKIADTKVVKANQA
jgi:uncharacterized RDD family membrane protein YckC